MDNYRNFSVPVKKRRGNVFLKVIMLLCVIVIVSITALYVRDGTAFDRLREDVITQKEEDEEGDGFKVNWDKIKNKDAVAWIRFKSIEEISYPVMQADDNSYYLHRNTKKTIFFRWFYFYGLP